jgi:hypothetical protein
MNGRSVLSFVFGLLLVGVLVAVGAGIYQAGVVQGVAQAATVAPGTAVAVPAYGYGWGWGFGFHWIFGLFFGLFFLFLIFGLIRAAFGRGRGWGPGGGRGGWGYGYGPGSGDPEAWRAERDRRMSEMHRRLHELEDQPGSPGSGSSRSGPDAGGSATGTPGGGSTR